MIRTQQGEKEHDPFLCTCGPCQKFWKDHYGGAQQLLLQPCQQRASATGIMYGPTKRRENHPSVLKVGDRVLVKGTHQGIVRYVGILDDNVIAPGMYVGVQLYDNVESLHSGMINGKRYFHCPRGHGVFVKYSEVIRINPPNKRPPLTGNSMFPSHNEIAARRKQRSVQDPSGEFGPVFSRPGSSQSRGSQHIRVHSSSSRAQHGDVAVKNVSTRAQRQRISLSTSNPQGKKVVNPKKDTLQTQQFGGGKRGEILAKTLKKLQLAYQEGLQYKQNQDEEVEDDKDHKNKK